LRLPNQRSVSGRRWLTRGSCLSAFACRSELRTPRSPGTRQLGACSSLGFLSQERIEGACCWSVVGGAATHFKPVPGPGICGNRWDSAHRFSPPGPGSPAWVSCHFGFVVHWRRRLLIAILAERHGLEVLLLLSFVSIDTTTGLILSSFIRKVDRSRANCLPYPNRASRELGICNQELGLGNLAQKLMALGVISVPTGNRCREARNAVAWRVRMRWLFGEHCRCQARIAGGQHQCRFAVDDSHWPCGP